MSATLILKGAVPFIALVAAVAAWMLGGAMPAGLTVLAFILGVLASEVHNLRWTAVEDDAVTAPVSDLRAIQAMQEDASLTFASDEAPPPEAVAEPEEPAPPPIPKRNFRCTRDELAIGSGRSTTTLAQRCRSHADRPLPRRRAEPVAAPPIQPPVAAAPAAPPRPVETHTLRFRAAYEAHLTA